MKRLIIGMLLIATLDITAHAQIMYPFPIQYFNLVMEGKQVKMAYMDVKPVAADSGKTILLLHGKNFNGFYWRNLIPYLTSAGYRVIIPDQVGWGKSDRPDLHYSFHMLANNTKLLLQKLGISKTLVLGHSIGGMLATRFIIMFPDMVDKLILENPIGLEDYKSFVPYQVIDSLTKKERNATLQSYKKYQESYYPVWKPEYQQYVNAQAADLQRPDFDQVAFVNAVTYQMIYEQPVCYEFNKIMVPTLLIIGEADRTVVGKDLLSDIDKKKYGNYPLLGKTTQDKIPGAELKIMEAVGHIPHVQDIKTFWRHVATWLHIENGN